MLRSNLLFSDSRRKNDELEHLLSIIGGTVFTNCITPAPDTPRSTGVFFTGKLPKENGMKSRSQWPGPTVPSSSETVFSQALKNGVRLKIVDESMSHIGLFFPKEIAHKSEYFRSLDELPQSNCASDRESIEIIFIVSMSYHGVVGVRHGHKSAHRSGARLIASELKNVKERLGLGLGDHLILFSDHGCKLSGDPYGDFDLLSRDRSQVTFFSTDFTSESLHFDNRLLSMLDIHYSIKGFIADRLSAENNQNTSLKDFVGDGRAIVHVEDHETYNTKIGDPVRKWGVYTKDFEYFETLKLGHELNLNPDSRISEAEAIQWSIEYLRENASNYSELKFQRDSLTSQEHTDFLGKHRYSDEPGRSKPLLTRIAKLFWRIATIKTSISRRTRSALVHKFSAKKLKHAGGSRQKIL